MLLLVYNSSSVLVFFFFFCSKKIVLMDLNGFKTPERPICIWYMICVKFNNFSLGWIRTVLVKVCLERNIVGRYSTWHVLLNLMKWQIYHWIYKIVTRRHKCKQIVRLNYLNSKHRYGYLISLYLCKIFHRCSNQRNKNLHHLIKLFENNIV